MRLSALLGLAAVLLPAALVLALAWLAERVRAGRERRLERQIAVTDAIHRELGAVVAPVLRKRPGGPWRVELALPLDCAAQVEQVLRVARRAVEALALAPYELVLVPRPATGRAPRSVAPRETAA